MAIVLYSCSDLYKFFKNKVTAHCFNGSHVVSMFIKNLTFCKNFIFKLDTSLLFYIMLKGIIHQYKMFCVAIS